MSPRKVEIFSAGCPICDEAVSLVQEMACPSCDVTVYDLSKGEGLNRARELGVAAVPSVAVNGMFCACCDRQPIDMKALQDMGIGQPLESERGH